MIQPRYCLLDVGLTNPRRTPLDSMSSISAFVSIGCLQCTGVALPPWDVNGPLKVLIPLRMVLCCTGVLRPVQSGPHHESTDNGHLTQMITIRKMQSSDLLPRECILCQ